METEFHMSVESESLVFDGGTTKGGATARESALSPPAPSAVAHVTWSLVAGGSEMYAYTIASHLNPEKFTSLMCAVDQGGALEPEVKRARIPYFIMNRRPGIELGLMWRLYRLFRERRVRVVHTHHFNQLFYSAIGAKLAGAKLIHTEHSIEHYKKRRFRIALRVLSIFCDKVVAIGSDGCGMLRDRVGIPERKLEIIRAGVEPGAFDESKSDARRALALDSQDRVVSIVARLYPEKNHLLLVRAFADVVKMVPRARLLIVGEGTEREAIIEEIARAGLNDAVQVLGVRRDVARILAASDAFVLSSDREGLPIAVLEAMAAARPVVATAVGDLPAVVRDGETGRVVPPKDRAALAAALVDVLTDSNRSQQMGVNGRKLAEKYGLRAMIERYEKIYAE